jgi:hypothetical protein
MGDRYLNDPDGPPVAVDHADCGAAVRVEVRCAVGHDVPWAEMRARYLPRPPLDVAEVG